MKKKKKSQKNTFNRDWPWGDLLVGICALAILLSALICYHTIKNSLFFTSSTLAFHESEWHRLLFIPALSLLILPFILIEHVKHSAPIIPKIDPKKKYSKKQKKEIQHSRKVSLIVVWAWAIITLLCLTLSFFPRVVLLKNNTIVKVNCFNQNKVFIENEDIKEYIVQTYTASSSAGIHYTTYHKITVTCIGDNKSESFNISDFRSKEDFFEYLYAKEDESIFFKVGENHDSEAMDFYHLTQEERQFLQSLPNYQ